MKDYWLKIKVDEVYFEVGLYVLNDFLKERMCHMVCAKNKQNTD